MSKQSEDGIDLVKTVFEHRLRQADLDRILTVLSESDRDELLFKVGDLLRHVSALMDVSSKVSDTLSLDVLLPRLMTIITDALAADRSTLFLHDRDTDELFSRVAQGDAIGEIRFPAQAGIAGSVFMAGDGIVIPDAYADSRFNPEIDRKTGYRTRNILCMPIRYKGNAIGVTQVLNKHDGDFGDEDMQLLEVTSAIASELKIDTLLAKVISATTEMLEADRSTLFMYDDETDQLWSRIAEGLEVKEIRFPSAAGIAGTCFTSGEVINIPDAYEDARFNQEVDKKTGYRTRTVLCMPVSNKAGKKLAVIQVLNKKGGPFKVVDERRLRAFSAQVAIALENAKLFDDVLNERNYNESILKSLSNGVLTLDVDLCVIKANDAVHRILGREDGELLGRTVRDLFPEDENRWLIESVDKVRESGDVDMSVDAELILSNAGTASVNATVVPLIDVGDRAIGYMLVLEDITAEKRVKSTMARYMTKEVADRLLESGEDALGGQSQVATVLFSDIRRFTTISEDLGPRETVSMLNDYFTDMIEVIFSYRGILDKYIGDAIMALFGTPFPSDDDADNAVAVANEMVRVLRRFNENRIAQGKLALDIGIGITGELVAGNIGSPKRMDYTVIGDTVNLAARLEGATKYYGVKAICSENTIEQLKVPSRHRALDRIRVKGKNQPVVVYESLDHYNGEVPGIDPAVLAFEKGLSYYFNCDWRRGASAFENALDHYADDRPSRIYLDRCRHYLDNPPAPDWDGVWTMTTK